MNYFKTVVLSAVLAVVTVAGGCSNSATKPEPAGRVAATDSPVSKWEGKLIRRPGSTPEDGKVYLVQGGKKRWVVSADWLKAHGFKIPEELIVIPAEELEAIPMGDPIQ
jgi:hypothetical protein